MKITDFTEPQMYEILGLTDNPTDRELEATILAKINKYDSLPAGETLAQLFRDMYSYFFDEPEAAEAAREGFQEKQDPAPQDAGAGVSLTQSISYTKDPNKLNPILKQTLTSFVVVDSHYRENKYLSSTNYIFNMSRPLRDVISMKLFSAQIPYSWWTISKSFGSNFFYLKGAAAGIDTGDFDYKIEIDPGNYTQDSLVAAINSQITNTLVPANPDTDFSGTQFIYNSIDGFATANIRIQKYYNESDYVLKFPDKVTDLSTSFYTIPYFLGWQNQNEYDFRSIFSAATSAIDSTNNENIFPLTTENNYFDIVQYTTDASAAAGVTIYDQYDSSFATIQNTYRITLSLPVPASYSIYAIYTNLNTTLQSSSYLTTESNITQVTRTTAAGEELFNKLTIKLNRNTTSNIAHSKLLVRFPTETAKTYPIWSAADSPDATDCCFDFAATQTELGLNHAWKPPLRTSYNVPDCSFSIICTKPFYDVSLNDVVVSVSGNTEYIISTYIAAINEGLTQANNSTIDQSYNTTGIFNTTNTYCFYETNSLRAGFSFDINKVFTRDFYSADFSSCILALDFDFPTETQDLKYTNTFAGYSVSTSAYTIYSTNNKITIYPKTDGPLQKVQPITLEIPVGYYDVITDLAAAIQTTFTSYYDDDGTQLFKGTTCRGQILAVGGSLSNIQAKLTISITMRKTLTERDYKVSFYDAAATADSSSNWYSDLRLFSEYSLATFNQMDPTTNIYFSRFKGFDMMSCANFSIDSSNDYFQIVPTSAGVIGSPTLTFTLPHGYYTAEQIIEELNTVLKSNSLTVGSTVTEDPETNIVTARIYVDKTFTARDYNLVFYDKYSWVSCNIGYSSTSNVTWDNTLGYLLGYQTDTYYELDGGNIPSSNTYSYDSTTNIVVLRADAILNVNLVQYALIVLDDYAGSHLNNDLVTVVGDNDVIQSTLSYSSYYLCVGGITDVNPNTHNSLTQNQIYAQTQIQQNAQATNEYIYNLGPNIKDIFAMVPLKLTGMSSGQIYTEFGGSMQSNTREYFGPVNISRMSVKLLNNMGNIMDLNGADWSFTIMVEQLYNASSAKPSASKK